MLETLFLTRKKLEEERAEEALEVHGALNENL
jgi:hypothetical protein